MSEDKVTVLEKIDAPWGKEIELHRVEYESGLAMLRLRIREGRRFTIIDLDADTARRMAEILGDFAR
ncbi:MAG: hypothetical protein H3C38_06880 [Rhodospirillales bacterium]|nr:hypothetical protein [Rhodospirillales bacterium]